MEVIESQEGQEIPCKAGGTLKSPRCNGCVRVISALCLVGAVLVTVALLIGTHLPPGNVPRVVLQIAPDKILHAVGYGTLAFLLYGGIRVRVHRRLRTYVWVILAVAALSVIDEMTQPLTGRDRDLLDFLASTAGAVLGATAAVFAEQIFVRLIAIKPVG